MLHIKIFAKLMRNHRNGKTLKGHSLKTVKDIKLILMDYSSGDLNLSLLSKRAVLVTCLQIFKCMQISVTLFFRVVHKRKFTDKQENRGKIFLLAFSLRKLRTIWTHSVTICYFKTWSQHDPSPTVSTNNLLHLNFAILPQVCIYAAVPQLPVGLIPYPMTHSG